MFSDSVSLLPHLLLWLVQLNKEQFDTLNNYNLYLIFLLRINVKEKKGRLFLKDLQLWCHHLGGTLVPHRNRVMEIFHAQGWFEFAYLVNANLFCGQHVWIPRCFSFVNLISASPFLAFLSTCWLPGVGFLLLYPSVKNLFTKYTKMQTTPEWDLASPCPEMALCQSTISNCY